MKPSQPRCKDLLKQEETDKIEFRGHTEISANPTMTGMNFPKNLARIDMENTRLNRNLNL